MLTPQEQQFLLNLARQTIEHYLNTGKIVDIDKATLPSPRLLQKQGTFVTLHTNQGDLRGCIGNLEGTDELYKDIVHNAFGAAFHDPRFLPVELDELPQIQIEISLLTPPQPLPYQNTADLLNKITPGRDGLILKKDGHTATFLPQVWEELNDKQDFLTHLSQKAGLSSDAWRDAEFFRYQVEKFSE